MNAHLNKPAQRNRKIQNYHSKGELMNNKQTQASNAFKCNNGGSYLVCFDCAEKYSKQDPYKHTITMRNHECYICGEHKKVGPSRKLFGLYISV